MGLTNDAFVQARTVPARQASARRPRPCAPDTPRVTPQSHPPGPPEHPRRYGPAWPSSPHLSSRWGRPCRRCRFPGPPQPRGGGWRAVMTSRRGAKVTSCAGKMAAGAGGCRKCLITGIWLISRRYPGPSLPRGTVYGVSRPGLELHQSRCYASGGRKGFISGFVENIKQELAKNKEMKESIKKFRDEAKKLEESDALQEARRKYKTIESETVKTSEVIKKKFEEITGTVKESLDEVSRSDIGRRIKEGVEEAAKTAKQSAESVSKGGEKLGKTAAFRAISQGVESVKKELDESVLGQSAPYRRPQRLRKRTESSGDSTRQERVFEANE
ncbi:mitochondrial import inner membrane translocase subunit TIM44 [Indicator indicator]|uniref:mitochondrial import inner membrane translocase subunit TIM44 n=1 Tax=Indicator indicator TaxID=1002788 RepID=UPI0023DEA070|nr:mitochondrial import inner membrane translocase subunit TIM44 [Indicator indicator]